MKKAIRLADSCGDYDWVGLSADATRVEGVLVKDIDAGDVTKELETLKTGGLVVGGWDFAVLGTRTNDDGRGRAMAMARGDLCG